ncbi:MAG: hypothetical protein M1820_007327 [Bogoriella megaspora]|nr:MAG: hypothetical protein M1820_007327 [Bogoriella megaspora]
MIFLNSELLALLLVAPCAFSTCSPVSADSTVNQTSSCTLGPGERSHQVVNHSSSFWTYQTFKSSKFNPPELDIITNDKPLAPGLLFLTPGNFGPTPATKDVAPMIMTDDGQLVWEGPTTTDTVTNLHVSTYQNNPVLTYWQGPVTVAPNTGHGYGNITFLDTSYSNILTFCPKLGLVTADNSTYPCEADVHESLVTSRDTLLFIAHNVTQADLSSIGGPENGWIYDSLVYDVEPRTGEILYRWSAIEHVPVNETKVSLTTGGQNQSVPLNYCMANSAVDVGDTYLINGRHTSTVYLVDNRQGDLIWRLNGEDGGDFGPLPSDGKFSWQHHVRAHNVTNNSMVVSMLNNDGSAFVNRSRDSTGLVLKLALPPSKANIHSVDAVLKSPASSVPVDTNGQGSVALLPNGNALIGYGQIPLAREYGPGEGSNTEIRWQARFGVDNLVQDYRIFKQEWEAIPTWPPSLYVDTTESASEDGCFSAYASWNGATDLMEWKVYVGPTEQTLSYIGSVPPRGFETKFRVGGPVLQVAAVTTNRHEYRSASVSV